MNVSQILEKLGYESIDESMMRNIMNHWMNRYNGTYGNKMIVRTNGGKKKSERRYNLMLEKLVCEAKSQLLLNERWKIQVEGDATAQAQLDKALEDNNFNDNVNMLYEMVSCLGIGATFVCKGKNGLPSIQFVYGQNIYPISVENNKITECAFVTTNYLKGSKIYQITVHSKGDDGLYRIKNILYDVKNDKELPASLMGVEAEGVYGETPTFQIYKPTAINHINLDSTFGVSIFATSHDIIDTANDIYTSYNWEFKIGKKRVMVASAVMKPVFDDSSRTIATIFDADDVIYQELGRSDEPFVKEIDMTLRVDEHTKAINDQLNYLSSRSGFGNSYFTYDGMYSKAKTATEVISKNQELEAAIQRDRLIIESCLVSMSKVILEMYGTDVGNVSLMWDDSIFEDESKRRTDILLLLREGHVEPVWALTQLFKITEEEAKRISVIPIADLLKMEELVIMKKTGVKLGATPQEDDELIGERDKPDKQFIDDNNNGI